MNVKMLKQKMRLCLACEICIFVYREKLMFIETDYKLSITVRKSRTCPSSIKSSLQGLFFQLEVYDFHIELKSGRGLPFAGTLVLEHFIEL